jgi:hypothetical protein
MWLICKVSNFNSYLLRAIHFLAFLDFLYTSHIIFENLTYIRVDYFIVFFIFISSFLGKLHFIYKYFEISHNEVTIIFFLK